MEKRKRVAVYGNSLNMAGIVASLKTDATLEVHWIKQDYPKARQSLDEKELAAIVIDLTDPTICLDVTLLHDRPGLLLIGVDPSKEEILTLSSQPVQALCMADLIRVIHHQELTFRSLRKENHELDHSRRSSETASGKEES